MSAPSVAITIVTFNSGRFIARCLHYCFEQDYPRFEVIVVDNASSDDTTAIVEQFKTRVTFVRNAHNVGFAAGQNQAIALSNTDWVLTLKSGCSA